MKLSLIIVLLSASLVFADPGEDLLVAARRGQLAEVTKLVAAGAPIEAKNQYGATPLYLAVFNGHTDVAKFLLEKGANPNVTDTFYKSSILDSALQKQKAEIVKALVASGVAVSPRQLNMTVGGGDIPTLQAALSAPFKPEDLTAALKAAIAEKKDDAAAVLRKAGAKEPVNVNISAETLASYAGEYVSAAIPLGIKVTAAGGALKAQADGQQEFALAADSPTEFSFAMAGIRMVFDQKGGFVLHQGGREFPFAKKGSAAAPEIRKVAAEVLSRYAGDYKTDAAPIEISLSGKDGQLLVDIPGQPQFPLKSESDTEFTFAPAGVRVVFNGGGKFTLFQRGKEIVFVKKESGQ